MTEDQIHYPILIDHAMRGVVREVLRRVQTTGLPGEHHFYISFLTGFSGVKMSEQLRARYPKEITIVMQHQYWDFKVEDLSFNVTLSFGGVPEKLTIPFAALTAFADPSIKFGLQFQHSDILEDVEDITLELPQTLATPDDEGTAEIISLDSFRKK
ncbi:MAG: hypothetical protein K2Q01_03855 [Rickettsiales bacterium]|nr:hypothetical protein [Rickettsiales bacterium]